MLKYPLIHKKPKLKLKVMNKLFLNGKTDFKTR